MSLYSPPPPLHDFDQDKPTLLVCWWSTIFCATIITLRVTGRFIRSERLFVEDKTAALALIPLFIRMGFVHVVLLFGTNNAQVEGAGLDATQLQQRSIGSGLVLASRFFYAATLWILKNAVLEFFKRLTSVTWERSYRTTLLAIRCILAATFVAVVISDLAECQPFSHYWQVLPDPGGQCRQGYAQLLTMAVCNSLTDLLLVFFPIPIILRSQLSITKKVQLVLLFSLGLGVVGVTLYRVPHIIWAQGSQQTRSLLASVELLFATAASNALVLGSFVRDRGVKKRKYKYGSVADSTDPSESSRSRRPTAIRHWGSDEDLVRDLGLGVEPELRENPEHPHAPPAPSYTPAGPAPTSSMTRDMRIWRFPEGKTASTGNSDGSRTPPGGGGGGSSSNSNNNQLSPSQTNTSNTPRRVSFFDVGGLLAAEPTADASRRGSHISGVEPVSSGAAPAPAVPAATNGLRRGSTAFLQDIGGLLTPSTSALSARPKAKARSELSPIPQSPETSPSPRPYRGSVGGGADMVLMDPGGLLGPPRKGS